MASDRSLVFGSNSRTELADSGPDGVDGLEDPPIGIDWRRRLAGGAFWVLVGRCLGMGVTLLSQVALTRLLVPDDFGRWGLLTSIVAFASTVAMFGLGNALLKQLASAAATGDARTAGRQLRVGLRVAIASTAVVAGGLPLLLLVVPFSLPNHVLFLLLAVANLVLFTWQQLLAECLRGLHEQRWANLLTGGQWGGPAQNLILLVLLLTAAVFTSPTLELLLALNLVSFACTLPVGAAALLAAWRGSFPASLPSSRIGECGPLSLPVVTDSLPELLRLCLPLMLVQLLVFLALQVDLWLAGWQFSPDDVALYVAAKRGMMLVFAPLQLAHLAVVAHIAQLHALDRRRELEQMLRGVATLAAIPSVLMVLVLLVAGGWILETLCGPHYRDAAGPLAVMGVGQLIYVWGGASDLTLVMTGHQRASLVVHAASVVLLVELAELAAPAGGLLGLAWASTAVVGLRTLVDWWLAHRLVGVWTHLRLAPRWSD